jgi:glycosyltransferase involved in cell wall biosynthesis
VNDLLHVVHVITRLDVGGAQETVVRTCTGLEQSFGVRTTILSGPDEGSGGDLAEVARSSGVEVRTIASLRGAIRPFEDLRCVRELTAELEQLRPAVLHTHSSKAGVLGRLAGRRAGVPVLVHTVHGWSFHPHQHPLAAGTYRMLERRMARRTSALVVVTEVDQRIGLAHDIGSADQYTLIRSGIPLDAAAHQSRSEMRRRLGWDPEEAVVISVGRLERQKDPVCLVEAMATVIASYPTARLALVGGGSDEPVVRAAAARAGISDRVDLLGVRDDVVDILAAADVFALSSLWEGLPRSVLEAVAAGLPVVTTDAGGVGEIIIDGVTGRVVPPQRPGELAHALLDTLGSPLRAQAMADAAALRLPEFTEQQMVTDTFSLYQRLTGERVGTSQRGGDRR